MSKIFISYAREDARLAFRLSESLKATGLDTWFDQERLLPGQNWAEEVRKAIRQSDYFIAVLSSLSLTKRGFVQRELRQALDILEEFPDSQVFLIPVRLDDCQIDHEKLSAIHWVNMFPSWEVGVDLILKTIRSSRGQLHANAALATSSESRDNMGGSPIPGAVIRELLETDVIRPQNYLGHLYKGLAIFLVSFVALAVLVVKFDVPDKNYAWENPVSGLLMLAYFTSFYLLLRGAVRWSWSYRARRRIVRSNEIVANVLKHEHPILFRLLLGSWVWQVVLFSILSLVAVLVFVDFILFLVIISGAARGEHGMAFFLLCIALMPAVASFLVLKHLGSIWRRFQARAGVPGFS